MKPLQHIFYVSSTHWDREWYLPFQGFRYRLVQVFDEVLDALEGDPAFTTFLADGQTSMVLDYLEARPECRARVEALASAGRLAVGPFFTMPDEFLVSGESLVRNLLRGHAQARELGANAVPYGYLCDVFGHIAQMPQILAGFGIRGALLGRGTNDDECPPHFLWKAPSGHGVTAFKVPETCGYGTFWYDVFFHEDRSIDALFARACAYVERERRRGADPVVVLMDGMDHMNIHREAPQLCAMLAAAYGCPATLASPDHIAQALAGADLPVRAGELIRPTHALVEHSQLISGTLSSRYDLKRANDAAQNRLHLVAEPLAARRHLHVPNVDRAMLHIAHGYLLRNHAHDSICGCSIDEVHRDMHYRFRQATAIAREIELAALPGEAAAPDDAPDGALTLALYNPAAEPFAGVAIARIDFPLDYAHTYYDHQPTERVNAFAITVDGAEAAVQVLSIERAMVRDIGGTHARERDGYWVAFWARVPAMGDALVRVEPRDHPTRHMGRLSPRPGVLENASVRLSVRPDGKLTLADKRTGRRYEGLGEWLDDGEIGDGWHHINPRHDRLLSSRGMPHRVEMLCDGFAAARMRVVHELELPEGIVDGTHPERARHAVRVRVAATYTLRADADHVEVDVRIDNAARDHRMRVRFPTGTGSATYWANQPFAFVERAVGCDAQTYAWKEDDDAARGFDGIALRRADDGCGLAFVSAAGLHEVEAADDEDASLIVTLLRSFARTHQTLGEPDGQLQGPLSFEYLLVPIDAQTTFADLHRKQARLRAPLMARTYDGRPQARDTLVALDSATAVLTALKIPEDGRAGEIVVRLCNLAADTTAARLRVPRGVAAAHACDLLERPVRALRPDGDGVAVPLAPWEIATVRVRVAGSGEG